MKFFTPELYASLRNDGDDGRAALSRAGAAYRRRLAELQAVLPPRPLALTELSGLEDGLLFRMERDPYRERLILTLRVGNIPAGYADLTLTYQGASIPPRRRTDPRDRDRHHPEPHDLRIRPPLPRA